MILNVLFAINERSRVQGPLAGYCPFNSQNMTFNVGFCWHRDPTQLRGQRQKKQARIYDDCTSLIQLHWFANLNIDISLFILNSIRWKMREKTIIFILKMLNARKKTYVKQMIGKLLLIALYFVTAGFKIRITCRARRQSGPKHHNTPWLHRHPESVGDTVLPMGCQSWRSSAICSTPSRQGTSLLAANR